MNSRKGSGHTLLRPFASACLLAAAVFLLQGCRQKSQQIISETELQPQLLGAETTETEYYTELYEIETETDLFGEVLLRSIWEVMPDETRLWAAAFHKEDVEKIVYTTYMEGDPDTYEITDPSMIEELFAALDQVQAGGSLGAGSRQGDVFEFIMRDGSSQAFIFSLTRIVVEGVAYETDYTEPLWELTGNIMFGEESLNETEF